MRKQAVPARLPQGSKFPCGSFAFCPKTEADVFGSQKGKPFDILDFVGHPTHLSRHMLQAAAAEQDERDRDLLSSQCMPDGQENTASPMKQLLVQTVHGMLHNACWQPMGWDSVPHFSLQEGWNGCRPQGAGRFGKKRGSRQGFLLQFDRIFHWSKRRLTVRKRLL